MHVERSQRIRNDGSNFLLEFLESRILERDEGNLIERQRKRSSLPYIAQLKWTQGERVARLHVGNEEKRQSIRERVLDFAKTRQRFQLPGKINLNGYGTELLVRVFRPGSHERGF